MLVEMHRQREVSSENEKRDSKGSSSGRQCQFNCPCRRVKPPACQAGMM